MIFDILVSRGVKTAKELEQLRILLCHNGLLLARNDLEHVELVKCLRYNPLVVIINLLKAPETWTSWDSNVVDAI